MHRDLALDIDNGVTLCAWCHGAEHGTSKVPDVAAVRHLAVAAQQALAQERREKERTRERAMAPTDLQSWRWRLGLTKTDAAEALGVSYSMYRYYEAGKREDGRAVEIPRTVALACAAIAFGLPPWRT